MRLKANFRFPRSSQRCQRSCSSDLDETPLRAAPRIRGCGREGSQQRPTTTKKTRRRRTTTTTLGACFQPALSVGNYLATSGDSYWPLTRDLPSGLPQIELANLARPIDRPLKRPRQREQRPHVTQIVINDRLPTHIPQRLDLLPHQHPAQQRLILQQPMNLVLERLKLRNRRRPRIPRRTITPQRRPHRVTRKPRAPRQLLDRNPGHEMLPTQLRPLLHPDHPILQARSTNQARTSPPAPRRLRHHPGGSIFNRRRGVSFPPAPTATRTSSGSKTTPTCRCASAR